MTSQSILVTGGSGFIGTHLCRKLTEQGHSVTVLDLREPGRSVPGVHYVRGDVRDEARVTQLLDGVSSVYHLAAIVSVPLCQVDPVGSYSTNFTGTLTVLEAIRKRALAGGTLPRVAFASSAAVYGNRGDDLRALAEEDVPDRFLSFYAAQKHASEQVLALYREAYRIPALSFRFFNVFGPGQDPASPYSGVITIFAKLAREGKPLPLNGGGTQTRDFISVHDIVGGLASALHLPETDWDGRAVNLATGHPITVRELAEQVLTASKSASHTISAAPRAGDVLHSKADISRAKALLGLEPRVSLKDGLRELLA